MTSLVSNLSNLTNRFLNTLAIKQNSVALYRFLFVSFLSSFLIVLLFTSNAGWPKSVTAAFYVLTTPLYYYLLVLVISTLLLPLFWFKWAIWLIALPKVLFDFMLLSDFFLYRVYRFHVDWMFIDMLLKDFKGVGISVWLAAIALIVALAVLALHVWLLHKLMKAKAFKLNMWWVNIGAFVLFLAGQLIHVVSYEYKNRPVTQYTPYLPYYAPVTSSSLMASLQSKFPSVFPKPNRNREDIDSLLVSGAGKVAEAGLFSYPKADLQCEAQSNQLPNILIFVAESWRQDTMTAEITPNIFNVASDPRSVAFRQHLSGGNVTVNGLFSLFFGLHPTYRQHIEIDPSRNQTVLTKQLAAMGYDIDVYTSSNLGPFSLKPLMFGDIADEHYFNPMDKKVFENDQAVIEAVVADLQDLNAKNSAADKASQSKPWFKFVFVTSSHHAYVYPDGFERFTPIETNPERFVFNPGMDPQPLFNRFKNSVVFVDDLFGRLWQVMDESGQQANTLSFITSDHGEEFDDNGIGFWGHGNNFSAPQVAVPMVVNIGEQVALKQGRGLDELSEAKNKLTGHIDVVPTVMQDVLACQNPVSDYSTGISLFDSKQEHLGMIVQSYIDTAYIINNGVYSTNMALGSYHFLDMQKALPKTEYQKLNQLKIQSTELLSR